MRLFIFLLSAVVAGFIGQASSFGFDFDDVVGKARSLSQKPYEAPEPIPAFLKNLSFSKYEEIRFKTEKSLWRSDHSRFQVMLVPPGLYYTHAVKINVVEKSGVHVVPYNKGDFTYPSKELERKIPPRLGYAGFKLTYPLKGTRDHDQFLVFAGASYFRGVGKHNVFGISARGIAVNTGLSSGEQFPDFIEYWLERPNPEADRMTFYALLNGRSLSGAYRFAVAPGVETKLQIEAVLFLRKGVKLLGIAPLTSMFFYGENTPRPRGEWRPQVHDSGGLLIRNGTGEWLWRPLVNPKQLRMNLFETENVKGFGLLQRQTRFCDYEDLEARYDKRPSAWVASNGDWGKGNVVLVELPTDEETEDNIVAFWAPKTTERADNPLEFAYALTFGGGSAAEEDMGKAVSTFVGEGDVIGGGKAKGSYRFVIDFAGGPLSDLPAQAEVSAIVTPEGGSQVLNQSVGYVKPSQRWRLSILAKPAEGKPLALRAFLKRGDKTLTETWTYSLPWDNKIK